MGISTPTTPLSVSRLSLFLLVSLSNLLPNLNGNEKNGAASHVFQERQHDQNQLQQNLEMVAPQASRGRKQKFWFPETGKGLDGAFSPTLAAQPNRDRDGGATGLTLLNANRD